MLEREKVAGLHSLGWRPAWDAGMEGAMEGASDDLCETGGEPGENRPGAGSLARSLVASDGLAMAGS